MEKVENLSKEIKYIKNLMEILVLKNIKTEIKNSKYGLNSR